MTDWVVRSIIKGVITEYPPTTETLARAEAINQNGTIADDLETDDGYTIRYLQMVLDGPDGDIAIVEIEPA